MSDTPVVRILPGNIQNLNETGLYLVGMISAQDVKALYESNLDTNAYTDVDKQVVSNILIGARELSPITSTDDYQVLVADFARQSIRINSSTLKIVSMPVMTEDYDGAKFAAIIEGDGNVKLLAGAGDYMVNQTHLSVLGESKYSRIEFEYDFALRTWIVCHSTGKWTGGAL